MMKTKIGILSAAYYLPPTKKTIADVFRDEDVPNLPLAADVDFQRDIGIENIHTAEDETAYDISLTASRLAIERAGIDPLEIDLIVDFTSIPEEYVAPTWSAAGYIQKELGAKRAYAIASNTGGCASFHVALKATCALMSANERLNTVLLFAGDKTPKLNKAYFPVTVVCDGGSAVILRKDYPANVILAVEVAAVGEIHDVLYVPGFPYRDPQEQNAEKYLHVTGDYQRFNDQVAPINLFMFRMVMRAAQKSAGVKADQIAYYIYPTFSSWDQKSFCRGFMIPPEKIYLEGLSRHGHLQENDMILNYLDATNAGHIHEGDIVMTTGNGAGFTWGAALIQR
jgi:3-oxoacyl-[acyl-carrier-protein] synthase-3